MPAAKSFKPEGCQQVIPYLIIQDPAKTVEFLKQVFGATEAHISRDPQGRIMHASMAIGDSMLMMGASMEQYPPQPAMIYLYVPDVDAVPARA